MIRTIVILTLVLAVFMPGLLPTSAKAWTTSNHKWLSSYYVPQIWEDGFYNYDHDSPWAYSGNVDWPVTMVFTMDADVEDVKRLLWGYAPPWDVEKWDLVSDNFGTYEWHKDRGSKSGPFWSTCAHMRPYAPYNGGTGKYQFYNVSWAYYCVGTTHRDNFPSWLKFGYSEYAEQDVVIDLYNKGYYVFDDYYNFGNYEPYRVEGGNHYWYNNGWTSEVMIF